MEKFELKFKAPVAKDLRNIPKEHVQKILLQIDRLATDPRAEGSKKLSGYDLYRRRVGKYRIVYEMRDHQLIIVVIKVGHRSKIYRRL